MKLPHFTQHGTRTSGDALDLFVEESALLRELLAKWNTTTPEHTMGDKAVTAKWDHGTIGKLLLEHAAVRLAASEDIARVLEEIGRTRESARLEETHHLVRPVLDQMYDNSRAASNRSRWPSPPDSSKPWSSCRSSCAPNWAAAESRARFDLTAALGPERARLRSAKFIRKHAPAHPGPERRWYDRVPALLRLHAAEDRLRGFPWGESSLGHRELAERYDREI